MRSISDRSYEALLRHLPELTDPRLVGREPRRVNAAGQLRRVWNTLNRKEIKRLNEIQDGRERQQKH